MFVRAKFKVQTITNSTYAKHMTIVKLEPVAADDIPENQRYHMYTPSGHIEMVIDNPPVAEQFELGRTFYVDFTPAE